MGMYKTAEFQCKVFDFVVILTLVKRWSGAESIVNIVRITEPKEWRSTNSSSAASSAILVRNSLT